MSSILDALERAAQERRQSNEEVLSSAISVADESQSPPCRRLLLGAVTIGVIIALWLLFADQTHQPEIVLGEKAQSSDSLAQPVATAGPERDIGQQSRRLNNLPLPGDKSVAEQIRNSGLPNQRPLVSEAVLSERRRPETLSVISSHGDSHSLANTNTVASVKKPQRPVATQGMKREEVVSAEPVVDEATHRVQTEQQQIPLVWELEQGLREELEQLKTSIHVYHQKPSQRFVIINMRRYTEGDNLGINGYRLYAIDRDGIIVDHGKGLVRLLRER
jgi:general secretion pathway protein B